MTRRFTVWGEPRGKGSPRTFMLKRTIGGVTKERPVTTANPKSRAYEALVQESYLAEHNGQEPLTGSVALSIKAFFPIAKNMSKKDRALVESGDLRPTKRPDCSNVLKSLEDGLNGVAWLDDKQVVDVRIEKWYGEKPRLEVEIESNV